MNQVTIGAVDWGSWGALVHGGMWVIRATHKPAACVCAPHRHDFSRCDLTSNRIDVYTRCNGCDSDINRAARTAIEQIHTP
jgi:hypothetical protein